MSHKEKLGVTRGGASFSSSSRADFNPPREKEAGMRVKMTASKKPDERRKRIEDKEFDSSEAEESSESEESEDSSESEDEESEESSEQEEESDDEEAKKKKKMKKNKKRKKKSSPSSSSKKKRKVKSKKTKQVKEFQKPKLIKWTDGEELLLANLMKKESAEMEAAQNRGSRVQRQAAKRWLSFEQEFARQGYLRSHKHISTKWHNMKTDYQ
jgi:Myb/SANT-like DNA-binding domain